MAAAQTPPAILTPSNTYLGPEPGQSVIDWLWDHPKNKDLVDEFLSNPFCQFCSQGADAEVLPFYQEFAIQDYYYLMAHVKFEALRLNSIPEHDVEEIMRGIKSIPSSVEFATDWLEKTCRDELGITDEKIKNTPRSAAELGYESYLHSNTHKVTWFDLHVIMVPCYYGWHRLAKKLDDDHEHTKRSTKFYKTFIKPNVTDKYAEDLRKFLDDEYEKWKAEALEARWLELFQKAMRIEIALFNDAMKISPNLNPIATVYLWGSTYIFSSMKGEITYLQIGGGQQRAWREITTVNGVPCADSLGSSAFAATIWSNEIRLYYIDKAYTIKELCLKQAGGEWKYGALTDKAFKAYPGSHLDAISTKELNVSDQDAIQIRVVFVDGQGAVSEAFIQRREWTKNIVLNPSPA